MPRRRIDDPQQRHLVARMRDRLQVGQHVAHFLAVVERHAADQRVGHLGAAQLGFERAGLLVGAEEDGHVARLDDVFGDEVPDLVDHAACFSRFVGVLHDARLLTFLAKSPQDLVVPLAVVGDQPIGHRQDGGGRTVVLFQADDRGVGPVAVEAQDVLDLGPAPAVDRLIVVADDAQIAMLVGQRLDDAVLRAIGVLVFVDQQVLEARGFGRPRGRKVLEQLLGTKEQIIEVDGARRLQGALVSAGRPWPPDVPCRWPPGPRRHRDARTRFSSG